MKKRRAKPSVIPVCSVAWCAALPLENGRCAVHVAVEDCRPIADYPSPDYWRDLDEEWEAAVATPVLPDTPEREECGDCEGSGECACCAGSGNMECQAAHCRHIHHCTSCDGDGECSDCQGTGFEDGKRGEKKKSETDSLVDRWMKNRPSQRQSQHEVRG